MTVPAASGVQHADTDELPVLDSSTSAHPRTPLPGLVHPLSVLLAALIGGGLAYSFDSSSRWAVIAVAVAQGLLIVAVLLDVELPGRAGALIIGVGGAVAADIAVTHKRNDVGSLVAVLGLAMVALFAHQLLRARRRARVVESLSSIALMLVAVVALSSLLELRHQTNGPAMATAVLLCATAALVAGHLIDWVWSPMRFDLAVSRGFPAVVVAVVAGASVSFVRLHDSIEFSGQRAAVLGGALAGVTALFAVGAAFFQLRTQPASRSKLMSVLLPVTSSIAATLFAFALMSPLAYLFCLALRG